MMRNSVFFRSWSRFDSLVWGLLLTLGLTTGLVLLRGDQVGVHVGQRFPAPGSVDVSTRTEIRLNFDVQMDRESVERRFEVTPPLEGDVSWREKTMIWRPRVALASDRRYMVTLAAGARSVQGRQLKEDLGWTFQTGRPKILFMSVGDVSQLFVSERSGAAARPLIPLDDGSSVWDYAVSPDGNQIVYSLVRPDASAVDLWLMQADGSDAHRLLACDDAQCTGAAWSPNGRWLAYERRDLKVDLGSVEAGPGPSRVWLSDFSQTRRLFDDGQMLGYGPRWSPDLDMRRLGYFDPQQGIRIVDLDTGSSRLIPNQMGAMGTWSPDGRSLALVDLSLAGESYQSYLLRADLDGDGIQRLSGPDVDVDDSSPVWSPTGEWIAFGRKALADGTPTAGQQLWLMRLDGSAAHPRVTDADAHLGGFAWSPDGRELAYVRFPLMQADARPAVWWVSLAEGDPVHLADEATLPAWLP